MDRTGIRGVRNIGILAHVDAGKTSLTERILHVSGVKKDAGGVDEGTTATDYLMVERSHGITVKSAAVRFDWQEYRFHLIDTPGHVDFGTEVDRALRVLDGAVIAICAVSGVQARTEFIVRAISGRNLPRICFMNKMDRRGADFAGTLDDLRTNLEPTAVAVHVPWTRDGAWAGVIDLPTMRVLSAFDEPADVARAPGEPAGPPVPASTGPAPSGPPPIAPPGAATLAPATFAAAAGSLPADDPSWVAALRARAELVEALADHDAAIMDDFVSGKPIGADSIRSALARCAREARLVPVLCGSAFSDASAEWLLDAVVECLPPPSEAGCPEGIDPATGASVTLEASPDAAFSAFVFKTRFDPEKGLLSWTRIWSGTVAAGDRLWDARSGRETRVRRIFGIQADHTEPEDSAVSGEIVALSLQDSGSDSGLGAPSQAGASLCERRRPIRYEALEIPASVATITLEPGGVQDTPRLRSALASLAAEDFALRVAEDGDTGRYNISGLGELHLEIVVERLAREYGVRVRTGKPRVSCRETPAKRVSRSVDFDRDFGGERVRAQARVRVEPAARGSGDSVDIPAALRIPSALAAAARRGMESGLGVGPTEGWPLTDALLALEELPLPSPAAGRSAETAVEAAVAMAVHAALVEAGSIVLEPLMRIDVDTPEECFGAALAALVARGGQIESVDDSPKGKSISAAAPLDRMFGFASELRSLSAGRAEFQAKFGRFEPKAARSR